MRKFFLLLLFAILCGQHLVYGQRGFDSLPESSIHIKFGDLIRLDSIEEAESYKFLFSLYGHVDTIQTARPYVAVSEYEGILSTFETYIVEVLYYTGEEWLYSNKSMQVMLVTDSGTDHLIHDLLKAGRMSSNNSTRSNPDPEFDPETFDVFPVVYHVVVPSWFDGDPMDYVSPADINRNITILNNVFSGQTGELGVDTHIRFKPALTDPINYCGQDYYGITYNVYNGNNINLDNSVRHPGNTYYAYDEHPEQSLIDYYNFFPYNQCINIWVFDNIIYHGDNEYGITLSPCISRNYRTTPILGIIKDVIRENDALYTRQLGYCVAHEMGHFFGLRHTWIERLTRPVIINGQLGFETEEIVDGIDDTPDALGPIYSCDYSNLDIIPFDNIMSYTPDGCRYRFTEGQIIRMRNNIVGVLNGWNYDTFEFEPNFSLPDDILDIRIVSPRTNYICSDSDIDIKIRTSDISIFERLEIEGGGDFMPLTFDDDPEPLGDNTYIIHVDLQQPLPAGNYNFTLYVGENACVPIPKQYEIIPCNNNNSLEMDNAQWYFDSYVTLDFRSGIANVGEFSAMDAHSSESGICDEDGNILFYTDGDKIWNGNHELLVSELNQTIVYRGTIVLQINENRYAVVSLCDNGHLFSRLLDGQGNIINTYEYNGTLYGGLTAVPCPTGGYWIVSAKQSVDGLKIVSIKLTDNGTFVYETGSERNLLSENTVDGKAISIKSSPDGKYIACAMAERNLQVFYFNATSGSFIEMDCTIAYSGKFPSIAFSPNGRFLYVSDRLVITQYDMKNENSCNCQGIPSNEILHKYNEGDYFKCELALQEGPDGRIYISKHGDFFEYSRTIGVIMAPNNRASRFHGYEDCHVIENLIDYEPGTILQNRENLPNLVDANNVDICAASFTICSSDCSLETLEVHNYSLSPSLTWTFYDMDGIYITSIQMSIPDQLEPNMSSITALDGYDSFIIEQTTGCGNIMRDTVIFNAVLSIAGTDTICRDGRFYEYGISLQPNDHIITADWSINGLSLDTGNLDFHTQARNTEQFTITCNATTRNSCMYTASFLVNETEISYVSTAYPYCRDDNQGSVEIIIYDDPTTNALPSYNFFDAYGNVHSNESLFSVGNLPLGEYTFDITNDYCHYEDGAEIVSALNDINVSVISECEDDIIRIWRNGYASLSGYSFALDGYDDLIFSTDGTALMFAVNNPDDNTPLMVGSDCSIDVTGPAPDFCSLRVDLHISPHPLVNIISHLIDGETIGYAEIIISNIGDPDIISFEGSNFNVEEGYLRDEFGKLHYYILNIPRDQMNNPNYILRISYLVGNEICEIYNGSIKKSIVKVDPKIEYHCETADIRLELAGDEPGFVEWRRPNGYYETTTIIETGNIYYTELQGVSAGIYHYSINYGHCIYEGIVEVLEFGEPEFTVEVTNSGNSTEVCVDIISLPLGINVLVAHDAAGNELINNPIVSGQRYCFNGTAGYHADIITICDTIPVYFNVFNINVDLEYETCYKSTASISFEISGGVAPYTATFTSGSLTTTQTFSNSGQNVMYAEIMQGAANSLVVVSADGHTYNITLNPINYISGFATLPNSGTGQLDNSYIGGTYIVTSGLTFDHNVTFNGCTIYCTYEDNGNITSTQWTVNGGKTVTLDTCTIKAACPDKMWQGIKVDGDANSAHSIVSQHGKVICRNGTTIEDAIKALESTNGGIIKATNSHFNNNKYDMYFNNYEFALGNKREPIYNCTFSTTRLLNDNSIFPDAHIYMHNVRGIYIGGCTFENTLPYRTSVQESGTVYFDQRGMGIMANTSHFHLILPCSFNKLFYGVHTNGFKSNAVIVQNSTFTDNHRAIYVNNNAGCKITNNNITAYNGVALLENPVRQIDYHVYIGSCSTFTFESNTLENATTGAYVYNSGVSGNQIQYNTFNVMPTEEGTPQYNAIIVTGVNSDYIAGNNFTGYTGLEILCNTFEGSTNDRNANAIFVKDGYMRREQGSSSAPTGNSFRYTNLNNYYMQFRTQFSTTTNSNLYDVYTRYEYYQHDEDEYNVPEVTHQLKNGHYNPLKVIARTSENFPYNEDYCLCRNGNDPIDPVFPSLPFLEINFTKSNILQLGATLDSAVNEFETKLDGGNTDNALMKVSTISSVSVPPIDDLSQNGYLSDSVCNALVDKIEENPEFVTSVFVENSPLPIETFEKVQDAEISNILKTVLSYYQSGENVRVTDERVIGNIKHKISLNENLLYDKILNDSLADADYNIIFDYFSAKADIDSKLKVCNILVSADNYDGARQLANDIRSIGTTEASNCADVIEMYISVIDTSMTKGMLMEHRTQLENYIADNNYLYSGIAETMYEYAFDTILPEYTPIFETEISTKTLKTGTTTGCYPYAIYPNPTSDLINIELASNVLDNDIIEFLKHYGLENIEDCATIEVNIYDVNSRLIDTGNYKYDTLISIDVSGYKSSTYLVEIRSCYNYVMQTKFVKL